MRRLRTPAPPLPEINVFQTIAIWHGAFLNLNAILVCDVTVMLRRSNPVTAAWHFENSVSATKKQEIAKALAKL